VRKYFRLSAGEYLRSSLVFFLRKKVTGQKLGLDIFIADHFQLGSKLNFSRGNSEKKKLNKHSEHSGRRTEFPIGLNYTRCAPEGYVNDKNRDILRDRTKVIVKK